MRQWKSISEAYYIQKNQSIIQASTMMQTIDVTLIEKAVVPYQQQQQKRGDFINTNPYTRFVRENIESQSCEDNW